MTKTTILLLLIAAIAIHTATAYRHEEGCTGCSGSDDDNDYPSSEDCKRNDQCSTGYCDLQLGLCERCIADVDCSSGFHCNFSSGKCIPTLTTTPTTAPVFQDSVTTTNPADFCAVCLDAFAANNGCQATTQQEAFAAVPEGCMPCMDAIDVSVKCGASPNCNTCADQFEVNGGCVATTPAQVLAAIPSGCSGCADSNMASFEAKCTVVLTTPSTATVITTTTVPSSGTTKSGTTSTTVSPSGTNVSGTTSTTVSPSGTNVFGTTTTTVSSSGTTESGSTSTTVSSSATASGTTTTAVSSSGATDSGEAAPTTTTTATSFPLENLYSEITTAVPSTAGSGVPVTVNVGDFFTSTSAAPTTEATTSVPNVNNLAVVTPAATGLSLWAILAIVLAVLALVVSMVVAHSIMKKKAAPELASGTFSDIEAPPSLPASLGLSARSPGGSMQTLVGGRFYQLMNSGIVQDRTLAVPLV